MWMKKTDGETNSPLIDCIDRGGPYSSCYSYASLQDVYSLILTRGLACLQAKSCDENYLITISIYTYIKLYQTEI